MTQNSGSGLNTVLALKPTKIARDYVMVLSIYHLIFYKEYAKEESI